MWGQDLTKPLVIIRTINFVKYIWAWHSTLQWRELCVHFQSEKSACSTAYYLPIKHFPKQALQPLDLIYLQESPWCGVVVAFSRNFSFPSNKNVILLLLRDAVPHPGAIFICHFSNCFNGLLDQESCSHMCAIADGRMIIVCNNL